MKLKNILAAFLVGVTCACAFTGRGAMAGTVFHRAFSPSEGSIAAVEKPYRDEICLNGKWRFEPVAVPAGYKRDTGVPPELPPPSVDRWEATPIKIPSPWNVNTWGNGRNVGAGTDRPYQPSSLYYPSYPETWDDAEMGWLRRSFSVPIGWRDKRVMLHFEAVAGDCEVLVNGHRAGHHFDNFLPFEFDVTEFVKRGGPNDLLVGVRSQNLFNHRSAKYPNFLKPYPHGSSLDGIVGIWQDVSLVALPATHISDTFVQPLVDTNTLVVQVTVQNSAATAERVQVGGVVRPWINLAGKDVLSAPEPKSRLGAVVLTIPDTYVNLSPHSSKTLTLRVGASGKLALWTPGAPKLYGLVLTTKRQHYATDIKYTRFGWRQLKIHGRDLLLNGKKIQMTGDLSHPFGPFMMSRRFVWSWYTMIKDFGGNAVRPHAQPYPQYYLDMADEMGVMVLDETGIFGSAIALNLEDPAAWPRYEAHYHGLIRRDRNHPSVFGWSVGNEMFAVLGQASKDDADVYRAKLAALARSSTALDPTRPWQSCDGDKDLVGGIPTWSAHFGHGLRLDSLPLASVDKPLMVGESGGTYYARPEQLAVFNGDRAYASYAGRNEALGIDLYQNVVQMARPSLAFYSASETVWFGLEHLNLGYHDYTRLPNAGDGVTFGPYTEGRFGMQPERIPPYVTTLNPGWDPALPLYKPLAMFDAMRAALHRPSPSDGPWTHIPPAQVVAPPVPTQTVVAFAGDRNGDLYKHLNLMGTPFAANDAEAARASTLIVDGQMLRAEDAPKIQQQIDAITRRGGAALIMIRDQTAPMDLVSKLLPFPVNATARQATMLEISHGNPWVDSFGLTDTYFAENSVDKHITKCGLDGAFVDRGTTLLSASSTDWSLFNNVPEVAKCGAVVLYEHLVKPRGAALVSAKMGQGTIVVSAMDYEPAADAYITFWRRLLSNMGVQMQPVRQKWLVATAFQGESGATWKYTTDKPADGWKEPGFNAGAWMTGQSGFGGEVPGSKPRTPWGANDIWLRTEFTTAPEDLENVNLMVHHDEDLEVYVNGTRVYQAGGFTTQYEPISLSADARKAFHPGRNTIAVHCHQTAGGQYVDVGVVSGAVISSGAAAQGHDLLLNGPKDQ
ncbi:MAG: glycoside hydrolase family 2 TIM barrel-domain containing protein [Capsulimonas sp.]|uniref:glycoside hydrolase family 2 protein n=1 Tax=Capsulimonas sp. TaxID=2494211 RepID=UPI0032647F77